MLNLRDNFGNYQVDKRLGCSQSVTKKLLLLKLNTVVDR